MAYRRLAQRIRTNTTAALTASWLALRDLDEETLSVWTRRGGVRLDTAQGQVGAATGAYLAATAPEGQRVPVGVPPEVVTSLALRGVPAEELLYRAPEQTWTALGEGEEPVDAVHRGTLRIMALVAVGLQLSHTHSSRHVLRRRNVELYKRGVRANACDLCAQSSGRVYRSSDLMPLHHGCACTVVPIWGSGDLPGEDSLADEAYEDEVAVREHGELGPVLTHRDYAFRGPSDIPR